MRFGLELFAWSTLCLHGEVAVGETGITLLGIKMQFQRYDRLALATGRHVSLPVNSLGQPSHHCGNRTVVGFPGGFGRIFAEFRRIKIDEQSLFYHA